MQKLANTKSALEEALSQIIYFIQRRITFSEFANVLAIPSLEVELDDNLTNCYPSVWLKLGDVSLVARTNMQGHVVQLDAIGPDSDGHRQIVDTIAGLFNTEITREERNFWPGNSVGTQFEVSEKHGNFNDQKRSSRCPAA